MKKNKPGEILYYYTSFEYGVDNIRNKHIKLSNIDGVNDIHELLGVYSKAESLQKHLLGIRIVYSHAAGMLCVSKDPVEPVMWGHYGKNNTGLCLGYRFNSEDLYEVEYRGNKVEIKETDKIQNMSQDRLNQMLTYKYKSWAYESEYRGFYHKDKCKWDELNDIYFLEIGKGQADNIELAEVIIGIDSPKNGSYINALLEKYDLLNHVVIYQTVKAGGEYKYSLEKYDSGFKRK